MKKQIINTSKAPAPIGPYNQAVMSADTLYISGQICLDVTTGELVNADIATETGMVMKNLKFILEEAKMNFSNVVKTTIFLGSMEFFAQVNEVYSKYFETDFPARETIAVKGLPKNVNVEISMIATL